MTTLLAACGPDGSFIASDSQATGYDVMNVGTKLHRLGDWLVIGSTGGMALHTFLRGHADIDRPDGLTGAVAALDALAEEWRGWRPAPSPDTATWGIGATPWGVFLLDAEGFVTFAQHVDAFAHVCGGSGGAPAAAALRALSWHAPGLDLETMVVSAVRSTCGLIDGCGGLVHLERVW